MLQYTAYFIMCLYVPKPSPTYSKTKLKCFFYYYYFLLEQMKVVTLEEEMW